MTAQNPNFDSNISKELPATDVFLPFPLPDGPRPNAIPGLSDHVRRLQKRNQGISHWLVFAVLGGVVVAFAMVQFAIR
jgi:hypothetical protein